MSNKKFTTKQAAEYLGVSTAFLERDRWAGARIPFCKYAEGRSGKVTYLKSDLDEFIENSKRSSTSEVKGGSTC
ncbi:MAG: helix-turn-helix domain-containing protein [Gammaproteobacteria bacterium]|nr:helix-turn-helix domain-containing protein [Gammaproteobacteria bacterium]